MSVWFLRGIVIYFVGLVRRYVAKIDSESTAWPQQIVLELDQSKESGVAVPTTKKAGVTRWIFATSR